MRTHIPQGHVRVRVVRRTSTGTIAKMARPLLHGSGASQSLADPREGGDADLAHVVMEAANPDVNPDVLFDGFTPPEVRCSQS